MRPPAPSGQPWAIHLMTVAGWVALPSRNGGTSRAACAGRRPGSFVKSMLMRLLVWVRGPSKTHTRSHLLDWPTSALHGRDHVRSRPIAALPAELLEEPV